MPQTKIGVLGGTFNPIHSGHIHLANRVRRLFGLSSVHFVTAALPPHKPHRDLLALEHRYAMVCLATSGQPLFIPSLIELERPQSPYSIDTLAKISRTAGTDASSIYFIAGADSLAEVSGWHESGRLLTTYNFVFAARPGFRASPPGDCLPAGLVRRVIDLRPPGATVPGRGKRPAIFVVEVAARRVSSSEIRALAAAGRDIGRLVPAPVREYILKLNLYGER